MVTDSDLARLDALVTTYGLKKTVEMLIELVDRRTERSTYSVRAIWQHDAHELRRVLPCIIHRGVERREIAVPEFLCRAN